MNMAQNIFPYRTNKWNKKLVFALFDGQIRIKNKCIWIHDSTSEPGMCMLLFKQAKSQRQCCGTITIFYASGSGSDF
jgi:hypothetical protein